MARAAAYASTYLQILFCPFLHFIFNITDVFQRKMLAVHCFTGNLIGALDFIPEAIVFEEIKNLYSLKMTKSFL